VNVTQRLHRTCAGTPSEAIGPRARERAKGAFLDTLGVMLAGSRETAAMLVAEYARDQRARGGDGRRGRGFRTGAAGGACERTSAHVLDYDDVQANMRGHPSADRPARTALGESSDRAGVMLDAYVLGRGGVQTRAHHREPLCAGMARDLHARDDRAAAACARLLRLDVERTRNALGMRPRWRADCSRTSGR
jgi:2-methylcitrate dehydratase PrpD